MVNRVIDFPDSYTTASAPVITDAGLTAHLADTSDAHDASAISNVPSGNLAATDVQAALNELQGDIDSLSGSAVEVAQDALAASFAAGAQDGATLVYNDGLNKFDLTNTDKGSAAVSSHESDTTAHPASSIVNTPSGNLAATEVQAALNELQSDIDTRALSSALTTHTGASSGVHGVTGSVVGTTDTQTMTNKTLTSPVINTPTGITKSDVGLGNVDNTSDASKNSATATLTNKTIGDAANYTQVVTPSNPSSGLNKLYFKSDNNLYSLTSAGVETQFGSASAPNSRIRLSTPSGNGSTNTTVRYFTVTSESVGSDISVTNSATNGTSITINTTGIYSVDWWNESNSAGTAVIILTNNSANLSTSPATSEYEAIAQGAATGNSANLARTYKYTAGDVLRPQTLTTAKPNSTGADTQFSIIRIA